MKIAIITERINTALGGAERSVFELAGALSALEMKVDILAAKGQMNADNVHVLCRDRPGKRTCYRTFAKALEKHLSGNHYDIVHSVLPFEFADVYQPRGGSYAETVRQNAVSYQNKLLERYKKITAFANLRRTALLRAEQKLSKNQDGPVVAALSQYVAEQFRQHYNLTDERLKIIPNGVKINRQTDTAEADRLRAQILIKLRVKEADEPVLFLFAAHNFRLKGLACLIKAMSTQPGFLIVAGNGKVHKYRQMAKKLNLHKKIVFLGPLRKIQTALAITDVAVLPTFYDPCSRFILEALTANKPVITTKFNGAADFFDDGRHGRIIDSPQNIGALAEAINYFTNKENIKNSSQAIIDDNLKEKISINRAAKELAALYESISQRKG